MTKYSPSLKKYKYWNLVLSHKQYPYIGRSYAVVKNNPDRSILEITKEERDELFDVILLEWNIAVKKVFNHAKINFIIAGNTNPVLHAHFIPRYQEPVEFGGVTFVDPQPDKNHSPYEKGELRIEVQKEIEDAIKNCL